MIDRTAWHEWRSGGLGASEVAGVIGESPWASPWSVWAAKVGLTKPDDNGTDSMQFGTDLEPVIAEWFRRSTGLYVVGEQMWCVHEKYSWARATVDGFVVESKPDGFEIIGVPDTLGVFEAKYTADSPWDEIPYHYFVQVQWQMFVTGAPHAWIACMHLPFGRPTFRVYDVPRDEGTIESLAERCWSFWNDYVVTGDPPDTDAHPATSAAIREAYDPDTIAPPDAVDFDEEMRDAVILLRNLKRNVRDLEVDIAECENEVKAALGTHVEGWWNGIRLVTWKAQTAQRLDAAALKAAHPDLHAQFTKPSTSRVLRLDKPKEPA